MTHPSRRKFAHKLIDATVIAPAERLGVVVDATREMFRGSGELKPGKAMVTTATAMSLGICACSAWWHFTFRNI